MPTMIDRAALHLHQIDMGTGASMRSYSYQEARTLRADLLAAGFTEQEVDGNGKLDMGDYFPEATLRDDQKVQLQNSPDELIESAAEYLDEHPDGVLMVAADGMDALILEVEDTPQVVWVKPDGEVCAMSGAWSQLKAGSED